MESTMIEHAAELGETYSDTLTGFTGIATAYVHYLHGPDMVHIENDTSGRYIEVSRLEHVTP